MNSTIDYRIRMNSAIERSSPLRSVDAVTMMGLGGILAL